MSYDVLYDVFWNKKILITFKVEDNSWPFEWLETILSLCREGSFNQRKVSEKILFASLKHLKHVKNESTFTVIFFMRPISLDFVEKWKKRHDGAHERESVLKPRWKYLKNTYEGIHFLVKLQAKGLQLY